MCPSPPALGQIKDLDAKLASFVTDGYVHLKGVINPVPIEELLGTVNATADGLDGAKQVNAGDPAAQALQTQVDAVAMRAAELAGLDCKPAMDQQKKAPYFIKKLWLDESLTPKITTITVGPGEGAGPLPWHLDHFTYYCNANHKDHIICYLPVVKPKADESNLCVVPYTALSARDYALTKHRGAMHFTQINEGNAKAIEAGGINLTKADHGKYIAVDDCDDTTPGFVMDTDIEKAKVSVVATCITAASSALLSVPCAELSAHSLPLAGHPSARALRPPPRARRRHPPHRRRQVVPHLAPLRPRPAAEGVHDVGRPPPVHEAQEGGARDHLLALREIPAVRADADAPQQGEARDAQAPYSRPPLDALQGDRP